jgi:outer membrane protein assembly factor BamB
MIQPARVFALVAVLLPLSNRPLVSQLQPLPGDLLWSLDVGAPLWAPLAHHEGVLFFGADDSTFYALDVNAREVKWSFRTAGINRSGARVFGGQVLFASDDGYLYALDEETGTEDWRVDIGGRDFDRRPPAPDPPYEYDYRHSAPLVHAGLVFVGSASGALHAVFRDIGLPAWSFQTAGPIRSTPSTDGRRVYFGSWDGTLYALDIESGAVAWTVDTEGVIQGSPATDAGRVIVGSRSARILAREAETGAEAWTHVRPDGSWIESSPVIYRDTVFVGSSDARSLFALDARTGDTIWSFDTGGWSWARPVIEEGAVYIGALGAAPYGQELDPGFFAVDQQTGKLNWEFTPEPVAGDSYVTGGVYAAPVIAGGVVYVAGVDGRLYALKQ